MRFALIAGALIYLVVSAALLLWLLQAGAFAPWREVALASRGAAPAPLTLLRQWISFDITTAISAMLGAFTALGCACAVVIGRRPRQAPADPFLEPIGDVPTPPHAPGYSALGLPRVAWPAPPYPDPERRSFAARPIKPVVPIDNQFRATCPPAWTADGGCIVPPGAAAVRNFFARSDRHG